MALIGYQDKPEYLSMWLCIILNVRIISADLGYLEQHRLQMVANLKQYFQDHKMAAHPDTLVLNLAGKKKA